MAVLHEYFSWEGAALVVIYHLYLVWMKPYGLAPVMKYIFEVNVLVHGPFLGVGESLEAMQWDVQYTHTSSFSASILACPVWMA